MIAAIPIREAEPSVVRSLESGRSPVIRPPHRYRKFIAGVVIFLLVFASLLPLVVNSDIAKSFISTRVTRSTGRALTINGPLRLHLFRWPPSIEAAGIELANSNWSANPVMLDLPQSRAEIDIISCVFHDRCRLPEVSLSNPNIILEKSSRGQANWTFQEQDETPDSGPSKAAEDGEGPVGIDHLQVDHGKLRYIDAAANTNLLLNLETGAEGDEAVRFSASGTYKRMPAKASGTGGSVLAIHDDSHPYPLDVSLTIGATTAKLKGTVRGLVKFSAADLSLDLHGNTLSDLYPILGLTLPPTPPYHISGRLKRTGKVWELEGFQGRVGNSDLSGLFKVDTGPERKMITAEIVSKLLDLKDLSGFLGAEPSKESAPPETAKEAQEENRKEPDDKVVPVREYRLNRLRAVDADFRLNGKAIRGLKNPIDELTLHMKLEDGVLTLEPLNFGIAKGNIISHVRVDARGDRMEASGEADFRKLQLSQLFPGNKLLERGFGIVGGRAEVSSHGNSPAALLSSLDGTIGIASTGGVISDLLLSLASLNGGEILEHLFTGDEDAQLRCAVSQFKAENGVLRPEFFVIDTESTVITAEGSVNLADESLDLKIYPEPKQPGILSARTPIRVSGSFKNPALLPDPKGLIVRGGIATALGFVNPIAALIAFIEPGTGKDQPCRDLISEVKHESGIKDSALAAKPEPAAASPKPPR